MDLFECITTRASCRAFLPKSVSKEALERILVAAGRSPSYMNSQPWEVIVVSGEKLNALSTSLHDKAVRQEKPAPEDANNLETVRICT